LAKWQNGKIFILFFAFYSLNSAQITKIKVIGCAEKKSASDGIIKYA